MWLSLIYDINLLDYQYDTGTEANLKQLSHELLLEDMLYGGVNLVDLSIFAGAWHSTEGDPQWNSACDLVKDSVIDFEDLMKLCEFWLR
jgi:hypothetical protein